MSLKTIFTLNRYIAIYYNKVVYKKISLQWSFQKKV